MDTQILDMLKMGVIEPCDDPQGWNSPILAVRKKDGTCRPCINFKNTVNGQINLTLETNDLLFIQL